MLTIISPAKTLDFDTAANTSISSQPELLKQSKTLISDLKKLSPEQISATMKISDKLGVLNFERYHDWKTPFTPNNAKQALLAFKGDVYSGLDADSFKTNDFKFAQQHLRILSGLYGLLRPLDLIQAYRLEMGSKFSSGNNKDLYEFWDSSLTTLLNQQLLILKTQHVVNLASNEYFKAIKKDSLNAEIITPIFKDAKNGKYKIISFYAKKARGLMSAYIIKNRIKTPGKLKNFDAEGYYFSAEESSENQLVFLREEQ